MRITLNPAALRVTSFSPAPGDEVQPGDTTLTTEESSRPSMYATCNTGCWTCGCGTYDGVCTSPGYNC